MTWSYRCPDCGTTSTVHEPGCGYTALAFETIQRAYTDVLSVLVTAGARTQSASSAPEGITFSQLASRVTDLVEDEQWRELHEDVLHTLKTHRLVTESDGVIRVQHPDDRASEIVPTYDPVKTVYEYGPADGAKDYAVYSMVSWCEMHDLTWPQTCAFVRRWLDETDAWEDLEWSEYTVGELLEGKRHVYDQGLGWMENAQNAKHAIEQSERPKAMNANEDAGTIDPEEITES